MSASFLSIAAVRMEDAGSTGGSNPRQKIAQLSEKVVDSNPYSRLMYVSPLLRWHASVPCVMSTHMLGWWRVLLTGR